MCRDVRAVVYLLIPTSNHNPFLCLVQCDKVVYLLIPTSNHNLGIASDATVLVVYLLIPTSNHNCGKGSEILQTLYIFWFLHQTTTTAALYAADGCCISFDSYIKPQLSGLRAWRLLRCISFDSYIKPQPCFPTACRQHRCISFDSYIKPQRRGCDRIQRQVVYLLIPTSNHNEGLSYYSSTALYIFWFLHQTTTVTYGEKTAKELYIFWFLHQTTTYALELSVILRCISFDSYIKPQLALWTYCIFIVVYLLIPTSNHNL